MSTPKPGEIRCPTCHRSTVPAAFCTQCGSAIPSDARIRPRGLDRDELQDRIRARRSGADPYRRGGTTDDAGPAYERYEPEPEDASARRARRQEARRRDEFDEPAAAAPVPAAPIETETPPSTPSPVRPDVTREHDDWVERRPVAPAAPPPVAAAEELEHVDHYDDAAYDADDYPYEYDEWDDESAHRSSGAGAFAVLGFLALGVLALLGGAVLAGVFSGDPNVGGADPTLTPSPTISATIDPSVEPSTRPEHRPEREPQRRTWSQRGPRRLPRRLHGRGAALHPGQSRRRRL